MSKSQTKIDFFYKTNLSNKQYEIKRYFYLIWENNYRPNLQAYWTNDKPDKINFIEHINCNYIKKGYYFYICGYFPDIGEKEYYLTKEKTYSNIPYLKSHLQKCIRQQDDNLAIPTCYHLIKLALQELLRRLPIIMLEDVSLHESFTTLIWLMLAKSNCKNFRFKKNIYEWLLGTIYVLCKINEKDILYDEINVDSIIDNIPVYEILDSYKDLEENELSILYCLHIRMAYGGMDCDIKMLKSFSKIFEDRFRLKKSNINNMLVRPISIFVKELEISDWNISAIDYHCNQKILEFINKKYDDISIDEIKKMIWYNSSSINNRIENDKYDIKSWNRIKDYVYKSQKYLLESGY